MALLLLRGAPLAEVDAVLFDKDGTLSNSEPRLVALAQARVDQAAVLLQQHDPHLHRSQGVRFRELLHQAFGLRDGQIDPAGTTAVASREHNLISMATVLALIGIGWPQAQAISEAIFQATDHLESSPGGRSPDVTDGLPALLEQLSGAGVRCAVISNDHTAGITRFLRGHALDGHFQGIWSADHHPRKPDPGAVTSLCGQLGLDPGRCALIGDADSDLRMAHQAGLAVALGYLSGWSQAPALDPSFAAIRHWSELGVRPVG